MLRVDTVVSEKEEPELFRENNTGHSKSQEELNQQNKDVAHEWPQVTALLIGSIITLTSGLIYSWTSPFILVLANDKLNYNIEEYEGTFMSAIHACGVVVASPFSYLLVNKIGRKATLLLSVLPQAICWILTVIGKHVMWFYVSRVFGGFGDALIFGALPLWAGEVATPKIRGSWGNCISVSYYGGMFLINIIGTYFNIQETAYIALGLIIVFIILFSLMPESPYYYITKGKYDDAKESLKWLLRKRNVDIEFLAIKTHVEMEMKESGKWRELFFVKSNRRGLILGVFLRFAQQLSGISVFECYTQFIFNKSGSNFSYQLSAMIFTFFLWTLSFGFSFVLDKLGRRKAFVFSCIGSSVALFVQALYFHFDDAGASFTKNLNWFPLTVLSMYLLSYTPGLAIIPTLVLSELFPSNIKTKGVAVLSTVMGISVLVGISIFHFINLNFNISIPFFIYAGFTVISAIIGVFYIPNTQGKTLEEIQRQLKSQKLS